MKISVHTLVKNEEKYLWYAVDSVINHVDELLLWDTGSTDNTPNIIDALSKKHSKKIKTKSVVQKDIETFTTIRQKMLKSTDADWVFILDADEVWWDEKIIQTTDLMRSNKKIETVVNRYRNLVGDVYHYQPESAGKYNIDGKTGHLTVRAMSMKNIEGLNVSKPHGQQGFFDASDVLVQDRNAKYRKWVDGVSYLHFTHLVRSGSLEQDKSVPKRDFKFKYEIGKDFPLDYYYPEAFFRDRPEFVKNVWIKMDDNTLRKAMWQTPLKKVKRLLPDFSGSGY